MGFFKFVTSVSQATFLHLQICDLFVISLIAVALGHAVCDAADADCLGCWNHTEAI